MPACLHQTGRQWIPSRSSGFHALKQTSPSVHRILTCLCILLFLGSQTRLASADPNLPVISNKTFAVTNSAYGAVGDGTTDNAAAIQSAINNAGAHGGGTVLIPANGTLSTYLSGPISLTNGINFQVDSGAMLQMLPYGTYPGSANFIGGSQLHDVEISGSGTIDGQGSAWWAVYNASNSLTRPHLIDIRSSTNLLVQNVTLQNSPMFHLVLMGGCINVTVQGITINTPWPSPNTDGIDLVGTNCLIRNCSISDGDDDIAMSPVTGTVASNILITNCTFGLGYGVAIGSNTAGGLSNLTVTSCSFNGTQYGIQMKSDNNTNTSGTLNGRGGLVQNLVYSNLTMSNMVRAAISIASYYNEYSGTSMTPFGASTQAVGSVAIPIWRNITISNVSAVVTGRQAGFLWGREEALITNVVMNHVTITAPSSFNVYNAQGIQFVDSQIAVTGKTNTLNLYNAQVTITNTVPSTNVVTLDGLDTPPTNNILAFFNAQATMARTNALGTDPFLTLAGSTLTVSNDLKMGSASTINFGIGTNATKLAVTRNVTLGGTLNITDGGGFTSGTYTLLTYGGTLTYNGLTLSTTPSANYVYTLSTNTLGQINLIVSLPPPPDPFVTWQSNYFGCAMCPQAQPNADPLGTGMSNTNKFLASFNPTNPAAFLHIVNVATSSANVIVTYLGASGDTNYFPGFQSRTNVLDFTIGDASANYTNGSWQDTFQTNILGVGLSAAGGEGSGLGTVTNMTDVGGATNGPSRYYRVRALSP
jgi:polygalacturonase